MHEAGSEKPSMTATFGVASHEMPARRISELLFDRRDHELIRIVNEVCSRAQDLEYTRRQYYAYFHPHGIKEMAESRSLRIAYSMIHLLSSLEIGGVDDRLGALRSLRAEVLDSAEGSMPKNTARVLMQIMKEIIRTRGDYRQQLELAHDFRITSAGKPRMVRKQLKAHHLLEMPEEWNQITFDDHVHDANTKGRKSSTHLIMDAWIKGIRRLRVVHYNYIEPRSASELLEAARIMEIDIRIGIEFSARFRRKFINLIWAPRGFADSQDFLRFLEEPEVAELMREGRKVSAYQQGYVTNLLEAFNRNHLHEIRRAFDIDLEPIDGGEFLEFVAIGQKSILHLVKFILMKVQRALQEKAKQLRGAYDHEGEGEQTRIQGWFEKMNHLDLETLIAGYLHPSRNPDVPNRLEPQDDDRDMPDLLKLSPRNLLSRLAALLPGFRITLNLSNVEAQDVLELLYDSRGLISRLELFNLKDWAEGKTGHIPAISRLQHAINEQSPITLKRLILEIIRGVEERDLPENEEQVRKLTAILHDIISLRNMYKGKPLKSRMGSDSTGAQRSHGMGLAVIETLPGRAQKQVRREIGVGRVVLPIQMPVYRQKTLLPRENMAKPLRILQRVAGCVAVVGDACCMQKQEWAVQADAIRLADPGNVITLGGAQGAASNDLCLHPTTSRKRRYMASWGYLNSHLRNALKVITGFVPAFATFALTKDWWLLAYFGAFIWFGVTGLRNILQSVLGGGGFRRSPLLRWNAYVSWDRIADSLLFTGFSVPLLDYLVKTLFLERIFGITTANEPVLLYTLMAVVNGAYISGHNALRGLPRGAVLGNFFRTILSIPIAVALNTVSGGLLTRFGVADPSDVLQKWAAIISKVASDLVAGIIEGTADRYNNIRLRFLEYRKKLSDVLDIQAKLELLFPETPTLELLESQRGLREKANAEARDLERIICIHSLDALYFWMFQPRARSALDQLLSSISEDERHIWITSQFTLLRQREISQMFIDGILGNDFARALSFYLSSSQNYLDAMKNCLKGQESGG